MKNSLFTLMLIAITFAFTSCSKDDAGSGTATLQITAGITNSGTRAMGAADLSFTSGYVWVREIVFDGTIAGGGSVSRTVERFSKIDFATGVATPSLDDIIIPAGTYNYVNLGVELRDEDTQPAIIMDGTYTRTDDTTSPIQFRFNSGEVFEAETSQQVTVNEDETVLARIVFDPDVWFSVVSTDALDNANVNNAGVIVISENSNSAIFDLVADRLDISTQSVFE